MHTFRRVPPFPRSLVGLTSDDWKEMADAHSSTYPSRLNLAQNDCKSFSLQLAKTLTGVEIARLDDLIMHTPSSKRGTNDSHAIPDLLDWS